MEKYAMLRLYNTFKFIVLFLIIQYFWTQAKDLNSSIKVELVKKNFATITNKKHPGNRIGYRFFEHSPLFYGKVPLSNRKANIDTFKITSALNQFKSEKNVFIYKKEIPRDSLWSKQNWTYYMLPVEDGVEVLLLVETFKRGLPEYYGVQQCFRLSGETNQNWRKEIACTPAFSEYDLWQKEDQPKTSLTSVLKDSEWCELPAAKKTFGARTPQGNAIDFLLSNGNVMNEVGPYHAEMLYPADYGLITRTDKNENWICGIYWENTSHVTNHHPADCLHSIVNIGNIPPFSKRLLRGKIYWFKGNKEKLLNHFQKDFLGESVKGKLRIASCQFPVSDNIKENANWIKKQMRHAKIKNCDIIHFPEGALSGYARADFDSFDNFDWNLLWQKTDDILVLAKQLKLWALLGSAHKLTGANKPHNSLYLINDQGEIIDRYDKRFCTSGDLEFYSPGDHFTSFEINDVKCGLLICYDLRFPELFREYRKMDMDVIFHSFYNARHVEDCIHPKIMPVTMQTRAATNYFYISLTNSSAPYSWPCYFITPNGLVDGKLERNKPGMLISDVDLSEDFYDASGAFRHDAMNGKLNSGEVVKDPRSVERSGY